MRYLTTELLTQLWVRYWKDPNLQVLRFGQYVFNETMYETTHSYYEPNAFKAYTELQESFYGN